MVICNSNLIDILKMFLNIVHISIINSIEPSWASIRSFDGGDLTSTVGGERHHQTENKYVVYVTSYIQYHQNM